MGTQRNSIILHILQESTRLDPRDGPLLLIERWQRDHCKTSCGRTAA